MSDQLVGIDSNEIIPPHSPIGCLSLELLHIIFVIARHDHPAAPFILSHVSRSWRSFVLASPLRWTSIVIGQAPLGRPFYYNLWLQRAQDLDLSLCIQASDLELTPENLHIVFYVLLVPDCHWKEIVLTGSVKHIKPALLSIMVRIIMNEFPKLRKLHIPQLNTSDWLASRFKRELPLMPHLESIAIHGNPFLLSPEFFSASPRLRQIHLVYFDDANVPARLNSLYQIIQCVSTHLEDLRIHISSEGSGHVSDRLPEEERLPPDSILLPRLRALDLSWGNNNHKGCLFNPMLHRLRIPNLLILRNLPLLVLEEGKFDPPLGLIHLELTGCASGEAALSKDMIPAFLHTFSLLHHLRSVKFEFITWHDGEFATALLSACPQLINIGLHACSYVRETDLRRLVEGRKASKEMTCLQYLGVLNCKGLQLDVQARAWFEVQLERFEYVAGGFFSR